MDLQRDSEFPPDLSPLAWVQEELRRSLEAVHKTLRRYLRDGGETRAAALGNEPTASAPLQAAAAQLHQVAGVLSLVGLKGGATVLRAAEQAVQDLARHPQNINAQVVETIERADFALLAFVARLLAGNKTSSLALYPPYQALQTLNAAERIHPADLWPQTFAWRELPAEPALRPLTAQSARAAFEAALLKHMREARPEQAAQLSELCAGLAAGFESAQARTLWQLAAAQFQAQSLGLLTADSHVKKLGSRLLAQLRAHLRADPQGGAVADERLAHDLLFFCAQASPAPEGQAPRLQAVREVYGLGPEQAGNYEDDSLGKIDPSWVSQARRRVGAAKESWSSAAEGETHRLAGMDEQFAALAESLTRLFPNGELLGQTLRRAIVATLRSNKPPRPDLAMEVATCLLYIDAALDDAVFDQPEQAERVRQLARRVEAVSHGDAPAPLEDWMEELYRRVSDRQTLGSVVHELRASLSEVERHADEYFRDPGKREVLIPVPGQLQAMRGVLTVLGLGQAAQACLRMRDEIDQLANTEIDTERGAPRELFERLANNLGALGFLIDMLSVQPQLAKTMFRFDEASGRLDPLMGRRSGAVALPSAQDLAPEATSAAAAPVAQIAAPPAPAVAPGPASQAAQAPHVAVPAVELELDEEMLDIFLEEAEEVVANAREALALLEQEPRSTEQMTVIRRAFHTLKGSSRMVGLKEFGEAAWACEQLYNDRLGADNGADPALQAFTAEALEHLASWCGEIAARSGTGRQALGLRRSADALRLEGRVLPIDWPADALPSGASELIEPEAAAAIADAGAAGIEAPPALEPEPVPEPEAAEHAETLTLDLEPPSFALDTLPDLSLDIIEAEPTPSRPAGLEPLVLELPELTELAQEPAAVAAEPAAAEAMAEIDAEAGTEQATELMLPTDMSADLVTETESAPVEAEFSLDLGPDLDQEPEAPVQKSAVPAEAEAEAESAAIEESTQLLDLDLLAEPAKAAGPAEPAEPSLDELPDFSLDLETGEMQMPTPVEAETELEPIEALAPIEPIEPAPTVPALSLVSGGAQAEPEPEPGEAAEAAEDEDSYKVIGPLRISITLFNIFLNEADELSRRLSTQLAEWALELAVPVPSSCEALAHALAGNAATVGYEDLSALARALEHALDRAGRAGGYSEAEAQLFIDAADELRRLLHQFAAGFLKSADAELIGSLNAYQPVEPLLTPSGSMGLDELDEMEAPASAGEHAERQMALDAAAQDDGDFIPGQPDQIDAELFPIFEEEAVDLLEQLHGLMREWLSHPQDRAKADACMRNLHTFKGGARLSGAMGLGERAHNMESALEALLSRGEWQRSDLLDLQDHSDGLAAAFEQLRRKLAQGGAEPAAPVAPAIPEMAAVPAAVEDAGIAAEALPEAMVPAESELVEALQAVEAPAAEEQLPEAAAGEEPAAVEAQGEPQLEQAVGAQPQIDWSRFRAGASSVASDDSGLAASAQAMMRVRAGLLDRMATQAGEVSIRRSRLESELSQMKGALQDLDDNLERLRSQLRELELQAEAQIGSRQEAALQAGSDFDPLEFDRYTRFQELTRMLAESVGDVATVQRGLQRNVQLGEDELAAQSRLTRELQDDLMRTRMVEFDSLAERLHRVVRQASREAGKQAQLEIKGGHIELDRSVLDRLTGAFEHLLRNSVSHGIETPDQRRAAGKSEVGAVRLQLAQEGNEVVLGFSDDGAGLDLPGIRERGEKLGLLTQGAELSDAQLAELIFEPGFSTASQLTELSGRGIGMDVVRSEVNTLGGYVDVHTESGKGAGFELRVPLTTALTQIVQLRYGEQSVAVPASLMESVQRLPLDLVSEAYDSGQLKLGDASLPFYWLGGLMNHSGRGLLQGRTLPVVLVRSGQQRLALHVDEVIGSQEVVVKNLGPQLSGVPGLASISLLASGEVALIYNPVGLAHWYGAAARGHAQHTHVDAVSAVEAPEVLAPLVMVVDDSLTVRRVTERLLKREGFRVLLAKDGMDAMEKLGAEELPLVVLSDIEMPRMDGFDLVRNMRADARLSSLPVIVISSRTAQKHRDFAHQLGVDHYLGKPYDDEQLLGLIGRYTGSVKVAH